MKLDWLIRLPVRCSAMNTSRVTIMAIMAQNHSSWATDLKTRKSMGMNFGKTDASFFYSCDYNQWGWG